MCRSTKWYIHYDQLGTKWLSSILLTRNLLKFIQTKSKCTWKHLAYGRFKPRKQFNHSQVLFSKSYVHTCCWITKNLNLGQSWISWFEIDVKLTTVSWGYDSHIWPRLALPATAVFMIWINLYFSFNFELDLEHCFYWLSPLAKPADLHCLTLLLRSRAQCQAAAW